MANEFFYRLLRGCVEALMILSVCLLIMPIFLFVFGIQVEEVLFSFALIPLTTAIGIFASKIKSKPLKLLILLGMAVLAFIFAFLFGLCEIATGFCIVLSVCFFLKQSMTTNYGVPGMRLAPLLVFSCIFCLVATLIFDRPELSQYKWAVEMSSIILTFLSIGVIYFERVLASGWYVNTRIPITKSVKKRNVIYFTVFALLVLIFSFFVLSFSVVNSAAHYLAQGILYIFGLPFSVFSGIKPDYYPSNPSNSGNNPQLPSSGTIGGAQAPSNIINEMNSSIFIRIIEILALIIILAGIIIFIVSIIKACINSYKKGLSKRKGLVTDLSVTDEEDFIEGDSVKTVGLFAKIVSRLNLPLTYSSLSDNIQRARFIYRKFTSTALKDNPISYTPRDSCKKAVKKGLLEENQANALTQTYEKARYGNIMPTDEEISEIKNIV